jgi:hypothetical protein
VLARLGELRRQSEQRLRGQSQQHIVLWILLDPVSERERQPDLSRWRVRAELQLRLCRLRRQQAQRLRNQHEHERRSLRRLQQSVSDGSYVLQWQLRLPSRQEAVQRHRSVRGVLRQ